MPDMAEPIAETRPPAMRLARAFTAEQRMADAIRALATDMAALAPFTRAGLGIGGAEAASVLWTRFHKFDAADPHWPDRDRYVLGCADCGPLLYTLLHLTGHAGVEAAELRRFGQEDSALPVQPQFAVHPAIEASAGAPGEAFGVAVGLALAERLLAARFGKSLVDHRTWAVVSDDDLASGVCQEAASLAGMLRLEKLTLLWHEAPTAADAEPSADDVPRRFAASGWTVRRVAGDDPAEIASALAMALRSKKPSLIACRATPERDAAWVDAQARSLRWPHAPFDLPEPIAAMWAKAGARGATARRGWLKRLARHQSRAEFERVMAGRLPDTFHETVAALKQALARGPASDGEASVTRQALDILSDAMPELVGATTDSASVMVGLDAIAPTGIGASFAGRVLRCGARAHGMAAVANGLALHGGSVPFGAGLMRAADAIRPALRLAAAMHQRVLHSLLQEPHAPPPPDHLAALRAMPNLHVFRPADPLELAESLELGLRRVDGPSVLVLSLPAPPGLRADGGENRCARGGYVLAEADGPRQATLIATGAEVAAAAEARAILASENIAVAVVSLPCWELFALQDEAYRATVLGGAPRFGIEAACAFGWECWLGADGQFIGMTGAPVAGNLGDIHRRYGLTPDAIAAFVRRRLAPPVSIA